MFFEELSTKKNGEKNLEGIFDLKMTTYLLPIAQ